MSNYMIDMQIDKKHFFKNMCDIIKNLICNFKKKLIHPSMITFAFLFTHQSWAPSIMPHNSFSHSRALPQTYLKNDELISFSTFSMKNIKLDNEPIFPKVLKQNLMRTLIIIYQEKLLNFREENIYSKEDLEYWLNILNTQFFDTLNLCKTIIFDCFYYNKLINRKALDKLYPNISTDDHRLMLLNVLHTLIQINYINLNITKNNKAEAVWKDIIEYIIKNDITKLIEFQKFHFKLAHLSNIRSVIFFWKVKQEDLPASIIDLMLSTINFSNNQNNIDIQIARRKIVSQIHSIIDELNLNNRKRSLFPLFYKKTNRPSRFVDDSLETIARHIIHRLSSSNKLIILCDFSSFLCIHQYIKWHLKLKEINKNTFSNKLKKTGIVLSMILVSAGTFKTYYPFLLDKNSENMKEIVLGIDIGYNAFWVLSFIISVIMFCYFS